MDDCKVCGASDDESSLFYFIEIDGLICQSCFTNHLKSKMESELHETALKFAKWVFFFGFAGGVVGGVIARIITLILEVLWLAVTR